MDFSFQRNPECYKISGCYCIKSNVCFQGWGKIAVKIFCSPHSSDSFILCG